MDILRKFPLFTEGPVLTILLQQLYTTEAARRAWWLRHQEGPLGILW
jgi:hypothetical protein